MLRSEVRYFSGSKTSWLADKTSSETLLSPGVLLSSMLVDVILATPRVTEQLVALLALDLEPLISWPG